MLQSSLEATMRIERRVLHWFDITCPFCYVGQQRIVDLARRGGRVLRLPFQAHPGIPDGGIDTQPPVGPMYAALEHEARVVGLRLQWPRRLPNSRCALAVAEWARRYTPKAASRLHRSLFADGDDIGDLDLVKRLARDAGVPLHELRAALANGSALQAVTQAEHLARTHGVSGTPAWLVGDHLITGLRGRADFEAAASPRVRSAPRKGSRKASRVGGR